MKWLVTQSRSYYGSQFEENGEGGLAEMEMDMLTSMHPRSDLQMQSDERAAVPSPSGASPSDVATASTTGTEADKRPGAGHAS